MGSWVTYAKDGVIKTLASLSLSVVNVKDYGAVGDGVTDDSTAINNAISALSVLGGIVYFPAGLYACGSTINVGDGTSSTVSTRQGIYLMGVAGPVIAGMVSGAISPTGYGAVGLKWIGAAGGTVVSVNGPLTGWGLSNLYFDGLGVAAVGLLVTSAQAGRNSNLAFTSFTFAEIQTQTVAVFSGILTNTMHNKWDSVFFVLPQISGATRALLFSGLVGANSCYEEWSNVTVNVVAPTAGNFAYGVAFRECDNVRIRGLHFACGAAPAGSYYPLVYNYAGASADWPADCKVEDVDFGDPTHYTAVALNSGSPSGSATPNKVVNISSTNSGGAGPPADPGLANLKWGYTASNP